MGLRCLPWLVLACLAHVAHADHAVKKADPMPPEISPVAAPGAGAAIKAAVPAPVSDDPPPGVLDPSKIRSLTNDPILGKADRIDGDETSGVVAFTFDDGPNPETTPHVIDALEKYNIPATFFIVTQRIVGKHGEKSRDILDRELKDGFLIGSHSVTHPNLKGASARTLDNEVDASLRTLAPQIHRPVGMFRPPYGALSGAGAARLKKLGLTNVLWSVDTLDWRAHNAGKLRKKVITMILKDNGGVVLMHDVKPITASIIADVLDDLEAENCARLAASKDPIIPVSLHYFLKDGKTPRPIPAGVQQRTDAYRAALPARCASRAPAPTVAPAAEVKSPPAASAPAP